MKFETSVLGICVGFLVLSSLCVSLYSQETTGTIRGFVTDPSGAAVGDARITATNTGTGRVYTAQTSVAGNYSIPLLPPGTYNLSVEASGFKTSVREGILIRITEVVALNIGLELGALTETISVQETVPLVQTDTSSEGRVIERRTISSLPLANRNFTQLLGLTAGVLTEPFNAERIGFGTQNPNVNGMRKGSNNYLLDGMVNNNPLNNAVEGVGTPSVDFLQEFKVITNMYSAEYGRNAGSIVNVVTRSGTNTFHGSAFEFLRNDKLDARPYFAGRRGQNVQNQFGATVGGPVIKNRTFFFFGYEGTRQRNTNSSDATVIGRVPTREERIGIIGGPVRDPLTGQPFANNTIPQSRINTTSALLLERYVPLPNVADPRNNFRQQYGTPFDMDQYTFRIDHEIGANDRLMGRHYYRGAEQFSASNRLPGFGRISEYSMNQLVLSETHIFRPNLINEFRFGYYWHPTAATDVDHNVTDPRTVGIQPMNDVLGLPGISVTGYLGYGTTGNDWADDIDSFLWNDTLSHIKGAHSLTYGGELRYAQPVSAGVPYQGRFGYNGQYTGDAFADFLLAAPNQTTIANGPGKVDMRDWSVSFFVQDAWKVSPRLTLNLGLRYEYNRPLTEVILGRLLNWYPDRYRGPGVDSGLVIGGETEGVPEATVFPDKNNFAPRFGFAYAMGPQSRTVLRGGFGLFFDTPTGQITQQKLFEPPYSAVQTASFRPTDPLNGYTFPRPVDLSRPTETVPGGRLEIRPIEAKGITDNVQQWNFGLQHELKTGLMVSGAYVGTHGLHLFRRRNVNYPRWIDGVLRRPYDGFSYINYQEHGANSIYHSFQFTLQKRWASAGSLMAAYTFGKVIDDAGSSTRYYTTATGDPANLRTSRGPADFDRTHRLVVSYSIDVPNPLGPDARGVAKILNGWEVSGVTTVQSGTPFSVTNAQSNLDHDGDAGNPGSGGRADSVPGVDPYTPGAVSERLDGYLNPAAFALAPRSRFGTLGRNRLRGPGAHLWDFRLSKVTPIREAINLRFLSEFFNLFNHAAFGNPGTVLGTSSFGTIRSTLSNARIIQFGLKLEF
jgi:outer membrane receptor protein involved in Fe transport